MHLDDVYDEVLNVAHGFGVDVDAPMASREFFERIISGFSGTKEELIAYVEAKMPEWFRALSERPDWLQNPEWQFFDGVPMIYIGHVDVPAKNDLFHDQARFFVFWHPQWDETKTVIQVS